MIKNGNYPIATITGGAIRVGKSIAIELAKEGYDIALHYHNSDEDAKIVAREVKLIGQNCNLYKADLSKHSQLMELLPRIIKEQGLPQILVNNAAIFKPSKLMETTEELFNEQMAINFKAPFFLTQQMAKYNKDMHKKASIINILDTHITRNTLPYFSYLLTKKSLADFTKMAASELGPDIRVNAVCPGTMLPSHADQTMDIIEQEAKDLPLGVPPTAEQIGQAIVYLSKTPYITGQLIFVDGGKSLL